MTDIAGEPIDSDILGLRELLRIGVSNKFGSELSRPFALPLPDERRVTEAVPVYESERK